nr:TonB-dependent receptor [Bacteroidales bacterium]
MKRIHIIIVALIFGFRIGLQAQENIDTININEIVISGNRVEVNKLNTPVTVTVISKEVIASQEESNILPVITRVTPGLFISEIGTAGFALGNGTSGQLSIRGVGGSPNAQVLMLVDGQPQYMGIFGHPLPNFHMSSNVEKVEVVRGPASLLYGSNAMGGVINVITKRQTEDGLNFFARGAYGSFNTQKYSAGAGYKKDKFSAGVSVHHDNTDGHRDTSAFSIVNLNAYANYEIDQHWKANAGFIVADYSFEDPGSAFNLSSRAFLGDISRKMATVSLLNQYENTQGGIYAFYNWGTHSFSDGWESDDVNSGLNIYQAYHGWKGGTVTAGIDFKKYGGIGSFGFLSDTFLTVKETATYLVIDQKIGDIININAGARYENHSSYGGELVPQAGVTVKAGAGMAIKGLVSKGFRSPTIMDLYLFAPNPNLGPERLMNYELSCLQSIGSMGRVELTGYLINGTNLISIQPNPNPGPPMI